MKHCECCDHPLQHLIRETVARYDAPIPPPTAKWMADHLNEGLKEWEEDQ